MVNAAGQSKFQINGGLKKNWTMENKFTKEQATKIKTDFKHLDGRNELPTNSGRFPFLIIAPPEFDLKFTQFVISKIYTGNSTNEFDYLDLLSPTHYSLHIIFMGVAHINETVVVHYDFLKWLEDNKTPFDFKKYGL